MSDSTPQCEEKCDPKTTYSFQRWLPFEKEIVNDLETEDALVVMGKGLGLSRIVTYFLRYNCCTQKFVICLNMNHLSKELNQVLQLSGCSIPSLPKVINSKTSVHDRLQLYKLGGSFYITARILVVDLLLNRIDRRYITGFLVYDAHRVIETSIEAFALRLFRQVNRIGFIKAFSDNAVALSFGFNKMKDVLKHLYLRKVILYPRFHSSIHQCLQEQQPQVYEIEMPISEKMRQIQEAALIAMEATLKETIQSIQSSEAIDLTMESVLAKSYSHTVRRQLDHIWHKTSTKTKQLVNDVSTLRQLISLLPSHDAVSFYSFLLNHETVSGKQRVPSPWLYTEAADRTFKAAKARIYEIVEDESGQPIQSVHSAQKGSYRLKLSLEWNPKWEALVQTLDEIERENGDKTKTVIGGSHVLIMVKDERTSAQIREFLTFGGDEMMLQRFGQYAMQKETFYRRRLGKQTRSLKFEQKLILKFASEFRNAMDTIPHAQMHAKAFKVKGKDRKRSYSRNETTKASDICTIGLSCQNLESFISRRDKSNIEKKKRTLLPSFSQRSRKSSYSIQISDSQSQITVCTYTNLFENGQGLYSLLYQLLPTSVILYDPDMTFVRQLETFCARHTVSMDIYFMVYENSTERAMYLHEIEQEKKAFERLIQQKSTLTIPIQAFPDPALTRTYPKYSMDTRNQGNRNLHRSKQSIQILVDIREFRSALPSMLHKESLQVIPLTLQVGDYILSRQICVERKSVGDLYSSLLSGRLYNQADQMTRKYAIPAVLIEFTDKKAFCLQDISELTSSISAMNIISKVTLLILHFPALRILWTRSPHATVDVFKALKRNQEDPKMENDGHGQKETSTEDRVEEGGGLGEEFYNVAAVDIVRKLPGITDFNYRSVLNRVKSLKELSLMSQESMIAMIGQIQGKKLFDFFNKRF